jgi:integrase
VIDVGRHADGSRRQVVRSGYPTKRQAQTALREELARQTAGLADVRGLTVSAFLEGWLAGKRRLRATTRRGYAGHIRRYLTPGLGAYRLADLRPHHIDAFYEDMLAGTYSGATTATVHDVHRTLRSALNLAVKRRLIPWNPALHVELPERTRPKTAVWTPDELSRFLSSSSHSRWYPLFHTMAFTGLRRGEALGLQWGAVDLTFGHLVVSTQLVDAGEGPRLGAPKTKSGARVVPLDALTVEVLRRRMADQTAEREAWGPAWRDHGLVFTREDGSPVRPDYATRLFTRLVRQANVPRIRLHDLRHTHASLALTRRVASDATAGGVRRIG